MASASTTNMDTSTTRLSLDNQSFLLSDLGILELKLSGDSIFSEPGFASISPRWRPFKKFDSSSAYLNHGYISSVEHSLSLPALASSSNRLLG